MCSQLFSRLPRSWNGHFLQFIPCHSASRRIIFTFETVNDLLTLFPKCLALALPAPFATCSAFIYPTV